MKYILLDINTTNINVLETALEPLFSDLIQSIIVNGVEGKEIANDNILDLSFSAWQLKIIPKSDDLIDDIIKELQTIINSLSLSNSVLMQIQEDFTNYSNQLIIHPNFQIGKFRIFNDLEDFQKNKHMLPNAIMVAQSTAFGTGKHETTAMCLQALEKLFSSGVKCNTALDVGTGSGILAIAIAKMWLCEVIATDLDELALSTANNFFQINEVSTHIKPLISEGFNNINKKNQYNIIVANILLQPLLSMMNDFAECLLDGGYLILSGILWQQKDSLIEKSKQFNFQVVELIKNNDWACVVFRKIEHEA